MRVKPSLIPRDIKSLIERDVITQEQLVITDEKSIITRDVNPGL